MPRNPRSRPRRCPPQDGRETPPRSSPSPYSRRPERIYWQCQRCGALADPIYGTGEFSYCPSCRASGTVMGEDGKIPSPALYDAWLRKQKAAASEGVSDTEALLKLLRSQRAQGDMTMKRKKTHSGTFHCPACFIEFELTAEESLKCDRCNGPLAEGSLDEVWSDDDEDEEDDE